MADTGSKTLNYPADLKYVKTHEYVNIEGDTATIGITSFAADQLGDVTYVELPKAGTSFKKDDKFGVIESVKSVSDLFAPLGGTVVSVNDRLASEPELVNLDCYGEGWMLKIKVTSVDELDDAMTADAYKQFVVD